MRITHMEPIAPEPSRCIEVESPDRLFAAGGDDGVSLVSHNSVLQRNVALACIMRPQSWRFLGIDLKMVELSSLNAYSNVVLGIATNVEDALSVLRFAQQTMMKRYDEMSQLGINDFNKLTGDRQGLMVMVDEMGELLSTSGVKTDEGKAEDELKGEAKMIIGSIARLGRAAGVHLLLATQRPDATILPGETKAQFGGRANCGRTDTNASSMILDNGEGTRVKAHPRGRVYIKIHGNGDHAQGFFADPTWIDNWLASKGLKPDGTPLNASSAATSTSLSSMGDMDAPAESTSNSDNDSGSDDDSNLMIAVDGNADNTIDADSTNGTDSVDNIDDDTMSFDDDGDTVAPEQKQPTVVNREGVELSLGGARQSTEDKYHRPEEDWDDDLANLIEMNRK